MAATLRERKPRSVAKEESEEIPTRKGTSTANHKHKVTKPTAKPRTSKTKVTAKKEEDEITVKTNEDGNSDNKGEVTMPANLPTEPTLSSDIITSDKQYWLMKAEPETRMVKGKDVKFSIDDLKDMETSHWDGVRNHEAKNNMKAMKKDDLVFFYHSNCKEPGIVGIMKVCKESYVDFTAFDTTHPYFDAKSKKEKPSWYMVDVEYVAHLKRPLGLHEIKSYGGSRYLQSLHLIKKSRLSVNKLTEEEFKVLLLADEKGPTGDLDSYVQEHINC